MSIRLIIAVKGSATSGNRGHAGRKGKVGGSAPKSAATAPVEQPAVVQPPAPAPEPPKPAPVAPVSAGAPPKGAKKAVSDSGKVAYLVNVDSERTYQGKPLKTMDAYTKDGDKLGRIEEVRYSEPNVKSGYRLAYDYTEKHKYWAYAANDKYSTTINRTTGSIARAIDDLYSRWDK